MTSTPPPITLRTAEPSRCPNPSVKARALTHLVFARPTFDPLARFLGDFGLTVVAQTEDVMYLRATERAPYTYRVERRAEAGFVGFGLEVGNHDDLETLASLPGASAITPVRHPGGGHAVTITDPSGFVVEAIHGQTPAEALRHRAPLPLNFGGARVRIDAFQRPPASAPEVLRLGHVVLEVADFQATCAWYTRHFGFLPSDVQVLPDGSPAVAFLRLDLGSSPADHHTLALAQGFRPTFSHAAFEVVDTDAVGIGQRVLCERGWSHAWGIGRHVLGSQIFDYWHDPYGDKHEHYCDGDLLTADAPMGVHAVSRAAMSQWGPVMPRAFTSPSLTPAAIAGLVHNLRRSPDLTVRKLLALARIFG